MKNELIKYNTGNLQKVKNLIDLTNKLLTVELDELKDDRESEKVDYSEIQNTLSKSNSSSFEDKLKAMLKLEAIVLEARKYKTQQDSIDQNKISN